MNEYLERIRAGHNLTQEEIKSVMHSIMSGEASEEQIHDFLVGLNDKGPTIEEITGAALIMRKFCVPIEVHRNIVLDTCGTGGDKLGTFNISTVSAFVVAAAGVTVAKHGNRSVSSNCGSADLLERLGVNIAMDVAHLSECLKQVGIAFLFAQNHHPAMKNVAPVRKALGVKTIFNILGPLTNPARATHQVMGVYSRDLVEPMANVLKNLGLRRALVVHGSDGLDEITTTANTFVAEFNGTDVVTYDIDPEEIGLSRAQLEDIQGGTIEVNLAIAEDILAGTASPRRDIVALNAAYALYIAEKVHNLEEGLSVATEMLTMGKAREKLEALKSYTQQCT